jgi:hypothetical protein
LGKHIDQYLLKLSFLFSFNQAYFSVYAEHTSNLRFEKAEGFASLRKELLASKKQVVFMDTETRVARDL